MLASRSIISKAIGFRPVPFCSVRRKISSSTKEKFVELEIKVPWGKIAGKLWNPNDTPPILALHGWQDNAGSFDKLMPLLPEKTSVFAIDLPGHGLSSWIPDGLEYTSFTYLYVIHRIKQHFGSEKIALMGHSFGSILSYVYSILHPDDIKFVIALDFFKPPKTPDNNGKSDAVKEIRKFFELEKSKNSRFGFTEEQTMAKLVEVNKNAIDEAAARIMMTRGTTKRSDGKVFVNRDPRVKLSVLEGTFNHKYPELIKSPYLILKGEDWHYNESEKSYFEAIEMMKKSSVDVRFFKVPGSHHFHLTHPEPAAKLMIPFLEKYN